MRNHRYAATIWNDLVSGAERLRIAVRLWFRLIGHISMQDESIKQAIGAPKAVQMHTSRFSLDNVQMAGSYQGRILGAIPYGF
jgi:hypothetical protein